MTTNNMETLISDNITKCETAVVNILSEVSKHIQSGVIDIPSVAGSVAKDMLPAQREATMNIQTIENDLANLYRMKVKLRHLKVMLSSANVIPAMIGKYQARIQGLMQDTEDSILSLQAIKDKYDTVFWFCSVATKTLNKENPNF